MSLHREIQISQLMDISSANRVAYFCRAIKAAEIGNRGACSYFRDRANRFELLRIKCLQRLQRYQNEYKKLPVE